MQSHPKVLISTIHPSGGGVTSMLKFIINCLEQRNYQITLAYYRPYSVSPELSVPLHKIFVKKPSIVKEEYFGVDAVGIGCWLPELEMTHYWPNKHWNKLIESHDLHLAVAGSCLAALPYVKKTIPFLGWVASDWQGDRVNRVRKFPWYRRLIDRVLISPIVKKLETNIISSNKLIALSEHTLKELNGLAQPNMVTKVLHMPIDTIKFSPKDKEHMDYQIGFVGRFEDPRKHVDLLLHSFAKIKKEIPNIRLLLVGDEISKTTQKMIESLNITGSVSAIPYVERSQLENVLQSLDVFVLPSYQEGLCIAALEAMSCGVPVVSTYCGGPESYIIDGVNGVLCEHNSNKIADKILQMYTDQNLRLSMAKETRETVVKGFSITQQVNKWWTYFDDQFQLH